MAGLARLLGKRRVVPPSQPAGHVAADNLSDGDDGGSGAGGVLERSSHWPRASGRPAQSGHRQDDQGCNRTPMPPGSITSSIPVNAAAAIAASRPPETSRAPSTSLSRAEYIRATPRAVMVPSDGMLQVRTSMRGCVPSVRQDATRHRPVLRRSRRETQRRATGRDLPRNPGQERPGTPKWTSSSIPSGPVTTSRGSAEMVGPVARRMISQAGT